MEELLISLWKITKDYADQKQLDDVAHDFVRELSESTYYNEINFNRLKQEDKYLCEAINNIMGFDEEDDENDELSFGDY